MPTPYDAPTGTLAGTATFRLMPTDDATDGPSTGTATSAAAGRALLLSYTWRHPDDGDQAGTLLLGVPDAEGSVAAAWVDSWHQASVIALAGRRTSSGAVVGYEYAPGWSWEIEVELREASLVMVMRNVVPEGEQDPAGPYVVTRADWS